MVGATGDGFHHFGDLKLKGFVGKFVSLHTDPYSSDSHSLSVTSNGVQKRNSLGITK